MQATFDAVSLNGMHKPSLHILIIGLSEPEHAASVLDFRRIDASISLNTKPLRTPEIKEALQKTTIDAVFVRRKPNSNLEKLYAILRKKNPDCIVVELLEAPLSAVSVEGTSLQSCRIVHDRSCVEFHLALQFVLQYTRLKVDFRRCKALLYLSEARISRLVNTSSIAIAYLYKGKILHANIPFLVLFNAASVEEAKRYPLLKLIDSSEREIFARYLAEVRQAPHLNTELTLTFKSVSGVPFYGKINASPTVVHGRHCYQLWVERLTKESPTEVIPMTKSLNVWNMPDKSTEPARTNPFDQVLKISKKPVQKETGLDVLLNALQHDELAKLHFCELYMQGRGALSRVLVDLDIVPGELKKINGLLAKMPDVSSNSLVYAHFWDQLLFRLVCDELIHESNPNRIYLVKLSRAMVADTEIIRWLYKMLKLLEGKSSQLMLLIDAHIPMNQIPQTHKAVELLRSGGCDIALSNFSVDTTPLFLYRRIKPEAVFLDTQWLSLLKEKSDGNLFLSRFVQQIERSGVSVVIPHAIQESRNRLLVMSANSFGQEKATKDRA